MNQDLIGNRKMSRNEDAQLKSNSKLKRLSNIVVPSYHKYSVGMPYKMPLRIEDEQNSQIAGEIKYKYQTSELTSVFVHLLYLKKFAEPPAELRNPSEKEMILDITHPFPKSIEHLRELKEVFHIPKESHPFFSKSSLAEDRRRSNQSAASGYYSKRNSKQGEVQKFKNSVAQRY